MHLLCKVMTKVFKWSTDTTVCRKELALPREGRKNEEPSSTRRVPRGSGWLIRFESCRSDVFFESVRSQEVFLLFSTIRYDGFSCRQTPFILELHQDWNITVVHYIASRFRGGLNQEKDAPQRGGHSGTRNALIEAAERELRAAEQELRAAIHKYNWLYQNWICRKTNKAIGFDAMRFGSPCISPSVNNGRKSGASRTIFAFFIFIFDSMLKVLALLNMVDSIS
jgi:hypothetical protein